MPFIPAVNTAQVRIIQLFHSQTVNNVFYVRNESGWSTSELTALCNLVITWWNDNLADQLSDDITLQAVAARNMAGPEEAGVEIQAPAGSGGNITTGGGLPGNVAVTVKFVTGLTGKSRRGRMFLSGLDEVSVNGNAITDLHRDGILSDFGVLRDTLLGAGYEPVVASFYHGTELVELPNGETRKRPVPRATALLTPIEQYTADVFLDSQRRRLTGRGV